MFVPYASMRVGVIRALGAGDPLHDHLAVLVDEDRHAYASLRQGAPLRARLRPSFRPASSPRRARIARPSSSFVPVRRITSGILRDVVSSSASTIPRATSSPRVMPPKMLMKKTRRAGVVHDQFVAVAHALGIRAAADVEKVGDLAAGIASPRPSSPSRGRRRWPSCRRFRRSGGSCGCRHPPARRAFRLRRAAALPATRANSGCWKSASSSSSTFASEATTLPSVVSASGLISTSFAPYAKEEIVQRSGDRRKLLCDNRDRVAPKRRARGR